MAVIAQFRGPKPVRLWTKREREVVFQVANSNLESVGVESEEKAEETGFVISVRRAMTPEEISTLPRRGPDPNTPPPDPRLVQEIDLMGELSDQQKAIVPATQEDLDRMRKNRS